MLFSRLDFSSYSAARGNSKIVIVLQIQPELRGQSKINSQPDRSVGADRPRSAHNFINAREFQGLCEGIGAHTHRFHEFSLQNLSRMHSKNLFALLGHDSKLPFLMIIDHLYLKSISVVPLKTDSVAIVYANAVLSCSVGAKSFELIAGR